MRSFEYFLFENFDAEQETSNPDNPRMFLGEEADELLSFTAQNTVNDCSYGACCARFGSLLVEKMISAGVLRREGASLLFDSPVFLREDAGVLYAQIAAKADGLAALVEKRLSDIRMCCSKIKNGFSVEQNLYHILCGMVFDGHFFDYLSERGALSVSRLHPSGLDYLTVVYERCEELKGLSDGMLCSYNRLANDKCSLQSFGDAQGDRFDFYRFFRLREKGMLPPKFQEAEAILAESCCADKEILLSETVSFVRMGQCAPAVRKLLELFDYTRGGELCVPVYTASHQKWIMEIEKIVECCLGEAVVCVLEDLASSIDITAVRHGVDRHEIANELYHIAFGSINEGLVSRGIVAAPDFIPGEGRGSKCIELYA